MKRIPRIVTIGWLLLLLAANLAYVFTVDPSNTGRIWGAGLAATFLFPAGLMISPLATTPYPGQGFVTAWKILVVASIPALLLVLLWPMTDYGSRLYKGVSSLISSLIFIVGVFFVRNACRRALEDADS